MASICFQLRPYLKFCSSLVLFHHDGTCETVMIRTGNATWANEWRKCQHQGKHNKHWRQIKSAGAMQKVYFRKPGDWLVGETEAQWDAHSELLHSHVWASMLIPMNSYLHIRGLQLCHDGLELMPVLDGEVHDCNSCNLFVLLSTRDRKIKRSWWGNGCL